MTAALVELAPATGAITFVGAGHLDNVILRAGGRARAARLHRRAARPAAARVCRTTRRPTRSSPATTLVLFSDGVTDAQDEADEEFGEERLLEVLRASVGAARDELIDRVFAAIDAFAGGAPQFDDITMLVVRRLPR